MFNKLEENLRKGSKGDLVTSLQKGLATLGYDAGPVDGIYGDQTKAAVRKFQDDHHLQADGIVGPTTGLAFHTYHKQKLVEMAQAQKAAAVAKGAPVKGAAPAKGVPQKGAAKAVAKKGAPAKAAPEKKEEKKKKSRFMKFDID